MRLKTSPTTSRGANIQLRWKIVLASGIISGGIISQSPLVQQKATGLGSFTESKSSFQKKKSQKPKVIIKRKATLDYDVDRNCLALPFIRPSGSYFLDSEIRSAPSPETVTPPFHVASYLGEKAKNHMMGDLAHFQLIKELLEGKEGGLTLDIGANQGFYTYYLAALGMQVHAFEIQKENFVSLQHGAEYNPKQISNKAHIYPIGMGTQTGRMSMGGTLYDGHLKGVVGQTDGTIQTTSLDCFVYHKIGQLGNDLLSNVVFIKIDVEGFEIAVLQGARKSLFGPKGHVGGLLMEVGPSRWNRAFVNFDNGVKEMKDVAGHFKNSYILVRTEGGFMQSCPPSLVFGSIKDKHPRELAGNKMYKVEMDEWEQLLKNLNDIGGDCNFWYTN